MTTARSPAPGAPKGAPDNIRHNPPCPLCSPEWIAEWRRAMRKAPAHNPAGGITIISTRSKS